MLAIVFTSAALLLLSAFSPAPIAPAMTGITALSGDARSHHEKWYWEENIARQIESESSLDPKPAPARSAD